MEQETEEASPEDLEAEFPQTPDGKTPTDAVSLEKQRAVIMRFLGGAISILKGARAQLDPLCPLRPAPDRGGPGLPICYASGATLNPPCVRH